MEITKENEEYTFTEYQEIARAIQTYIDGARNGDGELCVSSFYEHTHIVGSIGGEFSNHTKTEFKTAVTELGAATDIKHQIAFIDVSGPAAAARVEFYNWKGIRFTDFFVLYKHNGQWKISGKTYSSHSNN